MLKTHSFFSSRFQIQSDNQEFQEFKVHTPLMLMVYTTTYIGDRVLPDHTWNIVSRNRCNRRQFT